MAGTGVGKFSSTAGNNTSNMTVNFAENMAPSNVNNAARELMGHIYDMYKQLGDGYFEFGDGDATYTVARSDADTITITSSSDISSIYFPGRKIRITDGGANVVEGTIASSSHTSTTQTVNLTGISLASGTPTKVELGIDTAAFGGRIILDDDGDSYIEAPTDDQIEFYTGGAERLQINADGDIGLGTSSPSNVGSGRTLHIKGHNTDGANIRLQSTGDTADTDDMTIIKNNTQGIINLIGGDTFIIKTSNTERLSVDGDGVVSITTSGNGDNLSLISTDADANVGPNLRLYRNSGSPANSDSLGMIDFEGRNDNSQDVVYGQIETLTTDVADGAEDGYMNLSVMLAGTLRSRIEMDATEVVFNEASQDLDLRVESNGNTHMLFVDGGNNQVGIGTSSPSQTLSVAGNMDISATSRLYLDGGGDTFIEEVSSNNIAITTNNTERMRIHSAGNISIGTTDDHAKLTVMSTSSGSGANSDADELQIEGSGNAGMTIASGASSSGNIHFADVGAANVGILTYDHGSNQMKFGTSGSIKARIDTSGNVIVAKSSAAGGNTVGIELSANGQGLFTRDGGTVMNITRNSDDGELMKFIQDGSLEGTISVSGTTVSYGGFTGTHWSRLADNSKPTILRGTIMDSIDEMCDWYQAVAEVPAILWTADDPETQNTLWTEDDTLPEGVKVGDVRWAAFQTVGDVKEAAYTVKEPIALGDKSVGDAITFTSNATEYTGTIVKEDDVKHTKSKVSDTADSKKVYGVFSNWDDADDGLDGDVNDMNIAQVGTFIIRVNADVTVEAGDLLVSNGDGTAKLQDDDIIRSKTIAKVNSNIKVETYADGSYTVPCTLHC
jgi:hypothetical protein